MKKGDARREQLIQTAERLFYTNGYEKTSVQDILDALHFSKGGFYHHFDSKLALMEAICQTRTEEICRAARANLPKSGSAMEKLGAALRASALWNSGERSFVSLLIGVAYREDGALMREQMKQSQLAGLIDLVEQILREGCQAGDFWASDIRGTAEMVLRLYMQFTDEMAFLLARGEDGALAEKMTQKLWLYRDALERVLLAPLGSMVLFEADDLVALGRAILAERKAREGQPHRNPIDR